VGGWMGGWTVGVSGAVVGAGARWAWWMVVAALGMILRGENHNSVARANERRVLPKPCLQKRLAWQPARARQLTNHAHDVSAGGRPTKMPRLPVRSRQICKNRVCQLSR